MEKTIYLLLADGFEEIEAITPVDVLRRAGQVVKTVAVSGREMVEGAHGIALRADIAQKDFALPEDAAMLVLPGGPGVERLLDSELAKKAVQRAMEMDIYIGAICAAPLALYRFGALRGKKATAFPGVQPQLEGIEVSGAAVERDGKVITARAAGVSLQFAYRLVEALMGTPSADAVVERLYPEGFTF